MSILSPVSKPHVFCTLCEGDYHFGVAALLNSLLRAGFKGTFVIGFRGALPPWFGSLKAIDQNRATVGEIEVRPEPLTTPWMLANLKPRFMLDIFDRLVPDAASVTYADPDIVLEAPWSFFEKWMSRGVMMCEDCNLPALSRHHYLRRCWSEFIKETLGVAPDDSVERGYNSGFVGATRGRRSFVEAWQRALEALPAAGVPLEAFKPGTRFDPFFGTDQDALNMAVMMQSGLVCSLGQEGMGFVQGMPAMWHAVDPPKPWRRHYFRHLLATGQRISQAHRAYWAHAAGPVKAWSPWQLGVKRVMLNASIALSRFYHGAGG